MLAVSGTSALVLPFFIHPQQQQQSTSTGPSNDDGTDGDNGNTGSQPPNQTVEQAPNTPPGARRSVNLGNLASAIESCQAENHGIQKAMMAKVHSAMRADKAKQADHHMSVLAHQLDTPAAEKHLSACINSLRSFI